MHEYVWHNYCKKCLQIISYNEIMNNIMKSAALNQQVSVTNKYKA